VSSCRVFLFEQYYVRNCLEDCKGGEDSGGCKNWINNLDRTNTNTHRELGGGKLRLAPL